jgi:hypothetical protein
MPLVNQRQTATAKPDNARSQSKQRSHATSSRSAINKYGMQSNISYYCFGPSAHFGNSSSLTFLFSF